MCEARVIIKRADSEETIMEDAAAIVRDGDRYVVRNVLGERAEFSGTIEKVDLMSNVVIVGS
jgi:predicted RNA-binding protein